MSKLLINDQDKALVGSNGKAYAVGNMDVLKGYTSPVDFTAAAGKLLRLMRYGKCEQSGTPTPSAPVDIVCNNGAIKYGWHDIITSSALSGYGTYVSPSATAGNRAYKWLKDLPNGTYQFSVDGDYEIIVQWRDPADPADGVAQFYENLSGWMTSGEVVLNKSTGGYGIAVKRTRGTSSITPSIFDGVLHVQEHGLYVVGTPEVLTIGAQSASVENLLQVGDYADEQDIISGKITRRCGVCIYDGSQTIGDVFLSNTGGKDNGAIIVYPLATPTTENVTPQPLNTVAGTNTLTDTAEVSNPEYNLTYKI